MSRTVKTCKVKDFINYRLSGGLWKVGDRLPSERTLGNQLGLSRVTVRAALAELVADGVVEKIDRIGTVIRSAPDETTRPSVPKRTNSTSRQIFHALNSPLSGPRLDGLLLASSMHRSLREQTASRGDVLMALAGNDLMRVLKTKSVRPDGVVLAGTDLGPIVAALDHAMIPVVVVDSAPPELVRVDCVLPDLYATGQIIGGMALAEKRSKIVHIVGRWSNEERVQPNHRLVEYGMRDVLEGVVELKRAVYAATPHGVLPNEEKKKLEKLFGDEEIDCVVTTAGVHNALKGEISGIDKLLKTGLFIVMDYNLPAESKLHFKRVHMRGADIAAVALKRLYERIEGKLVADHLRFALPPEAVAC